jgi:uncharacterized protein YbjT (DUF2867 family)
MMLSALKGAGAHVKVFIRDAAQWPALQALGADSFALGDMEDADSIDAAVNGCDRILHIGPPMHPHEREITGRFIDAAKCHGLRRFIYYSVMHPLLRDIRHHRLKLDTEQLLVESGLVFTIVQPARYMQHLENIWASLLETGVHSMPFSTSQQFSVADLRDLAQATATIATQSGYEFGTYELAGPELLSQDDMAATIGRLLGREIRAEAASLEAMAEKARAKGASDDRVTQMLAMNAHYDAHGFRGNPTVLRWILGRSPATFEDYVTRLLERG